MKIGTKSLLFGVHQFLWHPICVGRAWRLLYQRWPNRVEWLAIFLHDVGYWGCSDMDGKCGRNHPKRGARLLYAFVKWWTKDELLAYSWWLMVVGHSKTYSAICRAPLSPLYYADKVAALMEPAWLYMLRAWMTGEDKEFIANSPVQDERLGTWFKWYREKVANEHLNRKEKLSVH